MPRTVLNPPENGLLPDGTRLGGWWHDDPAEAGRIVCDLCPRDCHLRPGDRGFCFVRENRDGQMVLSTYGRSTGFCIDPIEKKPLNHFYPGTSVLSFGTAGCNLGCKFCQNWSISKSREIEQLSEEATPQTIAAAAGRLGCRSVAFTYNDPVIWAEYAIDAARACRAAGVKTVAVTAGYITPQARPAFYEHIDAANVDLKGFTEHFYRHLTLSHLEPVKETLRWLVHESPVWTEITNLIIPRENDSPDELKAMCDWILEALGDQVPVHFTAFHPDFRLMDRERTPTQTLLAAHEIAVQTGLKYAYVGNVHSPKHQTTYCPGCRRPLIERVGYDIRRYDLSGAGCRHCGATIAGHYDAAPGTWGSRRQPVRISQFQTQGSGVDCGSNQPLEKTKPQLTPDPLSIDSLTNEHERDILRTASRLVAAATQGASDEPRPEELTTLADLPVLGAFVTLKRQGKLRSCCGFLGQDVPLAKALSAAARRSAGEDPRFPPIATRELVHLEVDVWLLHRLTPVTARGVARRDAIEIGRHGLQIARGQSRGLLLPGVAVDNGLTAEAFLEHVSMKAELPPTAWREDDTLLWTFEGRSIDGTLENLLAEPSAADRAPFTEADLAGLAEFCAGNLQAIELGATPNFFAPGLPDGNVHGVAITLVDGEGNELVQANRLSLKASLPLQSTLFSLTESLAEAIDRLRLPAEARRHCRPLVTILTDPAMHGTAAEPDLRGIDPQRHLLVVVQRNHSAAIYDPVQSASELLSAAVAEGLVSLPAAAQVFSLNSWSNAPRLRIANVPRPVVGQAIRPAAQAGRFYPAEPRELADLIDRCLQGPSVPAKRWPAAMVPHAGLMYSGRIAGQTLRRIAFPTTVIVIGPKHTPRGVEWAVAPHEAWSIPGGTLPADPQLARQLVEAIPGLALDAAAHAQEHAIEVELPLIARLAPQTKVVGIAIGEGDLAGCRRFAAGLASVMKSLPEPPLLLISSDMNHFASDAENRRLDEIALTAMQTLDPEQLYKTVTRHHISMCGVLPAVIVMETLQQLGRLQAIERVAYATSGDVSGDRSRVVGYAGMLLG